jgi:nucleoside-diphosphate kinase
MEQTLVMLKPDCVQRALCGEVISRFERAGLKIIAMKMVKPDRALVSRHYPSDAKWLSVVGGKTLESYQKYGIDPKKELGMTDPVEIGKTVKGWLVDFICSSPVIAMVLEGNHAVENVRKIVGSTLPLVAVPGTIRGDYAVDSPDLANARKRPIRNLIHASGSLDEAKFEIGLWFTKKEIFEYSRADEKVING